MYNFVLSSSFSGDPTSAAVRSWAHFHLQVRGLLQALIQFISNFCPSSIAPKFLKRFNRYPPFLSTFLSLSFTLHTAHCTLFALPHSLIVATHDRHRSVPASTLDRTFPVRLSAGGSPLTFLDRLLSIFLIESLANLPYRKKITAILP